MIGSVFILTALIFSAGAMVMYYLVYRGNTAVLNYARLSYHLMAMFVVSASAFLWYIILTHQYQYHYVYNYSMNSLSTGFLLSSFWGGQEGSFLLWLLLTAITGVFLQSYTSKKNDLEPRVMVTFTLSTTFLLIMVSPFFKNPFSYLWSEPVFINIKDIGRQYLNLPVLQGFFFSDAQTNSTMVRMSAELRAALSSAGISVNDFIVNGRGLNPQLLNFWMQIHPPVLFAGFALSAVPFAFAVAALIKNEYKDWIEHALPWLLAGSGVLGLGIMMGGYWAYEVLGWGGYWAWDPVENSSLIPWLVSVAVLHTMLGQKKNQSEGGEGKYVRVNLILCLSSYILVIYSTFLTRSGVLGDASVHSFVDPGRLVYSFLVLFIIIFLLLGAGLILYRWKSLSAKSAPDESILSREAALFTGAIVLCASAFIIFLGTSSPIFKISVDTSFYDKMNLPLAIIMGLLNGLSLLLKWKYTGRKELVKPLLIDSAAAIIVTVVIAILYGINNLLAVLLVLSSLFTIILNGAVVFKIIKGDFKKLGAYISHIGIAVFLLGVIGSASLAGEKDLKLLPNKPKEAFGYKFTFVDVVPFEANTKYKFLINVEQGGETKKAEPVMYISDFNNSLMREPSIINTFLKDIYISPLSYDTPNPHSDSFVKLSKGKPVTISGVDVTFEGFNLGKEQMQAMSEGKESEVTAEMTSMVNGKTEKFTLSAKLNGKEEKLTEYELPGTKTRIKLASLDARGIVEIEIVRPDEKPAVQQEPVLSISASIKPFISFVWLGVIIMCAGFAFSTVRRWKENAK
jgi:cytochrome c-type biogenesis protein CcmF